MKRFSIIGLVIALLLAFVIGASAQIAITKSEDGTTITYEDSSGNALLTIDETDGVSATSISATVESMADDTKFNFGDGNDWSAEYDEDGTDELRITGADMIIAGNSGAQTVYFRDSGISIASSTDGQLDITADTTLALTGNVTLGENDTGYDVTFYGATDSKYWSWDETNDLMDVAGDFDITGAVDITGTVQITGAITVGVSDTGHDITIYTAAADAVILVDESDNRLELNGTDLNLEDADILQFGDDQDVYMRWDATDFDILADADDSVLKIGDGTESFDVWIYGETAAANVILDASANTINLDGIDFQLEDADILQFGDGQDFAFTYSGTAFALTTAATDDWTIGATGELINTTLHGALTVGANTDGHDVQFFGTTDGASLLWDESGDELIFAAGASIDLTAEVVMVDFKDGDASTVDPSSTAEDGWININVDGTKKYIPWYDAS